MKKLLSLLLVLTMLLSMAPAIAIAADGDTETRSAQSTAVDVDSRYDYRDIFDDNSTRYDGRIWTYKTVLNDKLYTTEMFTS